MAYNFRTSQGNFPAQGSNIQRRNNKDELPIAHSILDITESDEDEFVDLTAEEPEFWITRIERPPSPGITDQRHPIRIARNLPISAPYISLDFCLHNNIKINAKANVELLDGSFMRIVYVIQDVNTMVITIRGWLFRRTKDMNDQLEKKTNEVCWIMHVDQDDTRDCKMQGMETRSIDEVVKRRRIILTNRSFPDLSYRDDVSGESEEVIVSQHVLVCRVKYVRIYETAQDRERNRPSEQMYQRLRASECDQRSEAAVDGILQEIWRGPTIKGGACESWTPGEEDFLRLESKDHQGRRPPVLVTPYGRPTTSMYGGEVANLVTKQSASAFVLNERRSQAPRLELGSRSSHSIGTGSGTATEPIMLYDARARSRTDGHRYTFGDSFCGAGGTSRGAIMASLNVKWGFDSDSAACKSFARNFKNSTIYNLWADEVLSLSENHELKVDIAHISPPCQPYSPAHTTEGKDDERNQASLFAIAQILLRAKPRIVTLEQTDGLPSRHPIFFASVIHIFNSHNYSVRWKVINLADFGLPQRRSRLIMIASCPGEVLPPFPKPPHTSDPPTGLLPWITINQAIESIPEGWANHNPNRVRSRNLPAETGDRLARTMTTSGDGMVHPSGTRSLTHREYACLQKFPLEHKFGERGITKQIGNAVPPCMAKPLFETIIKALLRADGLL